LVESWSSLATTASVRICDTIKSPDRPLNGEAFATPITIKRAIVKTCG